MAALGKFLFSFWPFLFPNGWNTPAYLSLLSMDIAQMFLHRRSRLRVACWMESHSASVAHASQSCSRTSHRLRTEATPVLCFSMSLCSSCRECDTPYEGLVCRWEKAHQYPPADKWLGQTWTNTSFPPVLEVSSTAFMKYSELKSMRK